MDERDLLSLLAIGGGSFNRQGAAALCMEHLIF